MRNNKNEVGAVEIQTVLFISILATIVVIGVKTWLMLQAQQSANQAALIVAEVLSGQPATQVPGQPSMMEQAIETGRRQIMANYPEVKEADIVVKTVPAYAGPQGWAPVAGDPFEVIVSFKWEVWGEKMLTTGRSQGKFHWEKEAL